MAGFTAIASVGISLARLLNAAFADREPVPGRTARAALVRAEDFEGNAMQGLIPDIGLSLLLLRVDPNKATRAGWSAAGQASGRGHLALDLHYLLTPWAANAEHQHMVLGRTLQALEETPTLAGPLLTGPALPLPAYADEPDPAALDSVQLLLDEVSTESLMRVFDTLPCDYRLSVPYIARVVRIDTRLRRAGPPVVDAEARFRVPR
jgi:hypothetical protein